MKTSIIIPCKDETQALTALAEAIEPWKALGDYEIVFVDDGSTDGTSKAISSLFPGAHLLKHDINKGIGAALTTGSLAARGEIIVWFDSDATYEPGLVLEMVDSLQRGNAAAVTLSPWHPEGGAEGLDQWRAFLSRSISKIYNLAGPGDLFTYSAMVRAHRREAILKALPRKMGFPGVTESLLRILLQGGKIIEVPAVLKRRESGHSKMGIARAVFGHLSLIYELLMGRI